ncbi:MAG: sulfotransferase [Phycisphaerae bacterium]|nr:sulfotransferase [Phycisphaerae bacterium]
MIPESLQPDFIAALEAHQRGDRDHARTKLADIIARHPDCHEAIVMHADISAESGDLQTAEAALRRALEHAPEQPEYLQRLARILLRQRRPIEAAEIIERLIAMRPADATLHTELANIRLFARQFVPAEAAFRRAIDIDPASTTAGSGLILALAGQERNEDAVAEALRFTERCPHVAEPYARLAILLERLDRIDEARPHAEKAVAIDPSHGLALFALGTIQLRAGELEPARRTLERAEAVATDPNDRSAVARTLGQTLDRLARYDDAFRKFADSKPAAETLSPAIRHMTDELLRFIDASRRVLDPWAVASWGDAPSYKAFSTPPIFVVGFPASGATLCQRMLAAHGSFITADELPAMSKLREHLQRHAPGIENVPAYLARIGEPEIRILRAHYFNEIERLLARQDPIGKRLVDHHSINLAHLPIVRRIFPDAPVIVCIRDPRDAVLSAFMQPARGPVAAALLSSLPRAADYCNAIMQLWIHLREVLGLRSIEVRYENLVTNTEDEARRITTFLNETWNPDILRKINRGQAPDDFTPQSIGRWKNYRGHFGAALDSLNPLVKALGYTPD